MLHFAGEDYAKRPGLPVSELTAFLRDIDFQPAWRARSDVDSDYYDSNQYDSKTLQLMQERGIPPIVINLIAPTINLVLGMEAKVRQDWVVRADDDEHIDFAAAMTKELQAAERGSYADRACSDAYAQQVKAGLGWVHTYRQRMNPLAFPYVCENVHRREIWWDWHDMDPLLRYARWLVRRKWYDADVIISKFRQHKDLLEHVVAGWDIFEDNRMLDEGHPLFQDYMSQRDFHWGADQWRNLDRKRLALYEVWYRVWGDKYLFKYPDERIETFDPLNPRQLHVELLRREQGAVIRSSVPETRLSWWVGPHRLADFASPLPHEDFPYVPFWGYREDRTGVPYGHIRAMRPMQDEVNARRSRMLWQLSARRLIGVGEAVGDKRAIELEIARPDAAVWLKEEVMKGRRIEDVLRVDDNLGLNAQQMGAYQDAKETLQDLSNVFKEQLGKAGAADSGIAISQLIEQGTTALAELNDNYNFARTAVGNQLFSLVRAEIGRQERAVTIEKGLGQKKKVVLNERIYDPDLGITYRSNDVELTRAKVVLDDAPASATYRQFQFKELVNLARGLTESIPSPALQAAMIDMVVMASDAPNREEIAKRLRDALGIQNTDVENMSEEERAAFADKMEAEEMMAKLREEMQLLAKERADLENRELDAKVEKLEEEVKKVRAETAKIAAEADHTEVETERLERAPDETEDAGVPGADPNLMPMKDVA